MAANSKAWVAFLAAGLTVVAAALIWSPPPPRQKMLNIQISPARDQGEDRALRCRVVISNVSDYAVFYYSGVKEADLDFEYLVDGTWQERREREFGGGICLLRPREVLTAVVPVNVHADAVRAGLTFTVASWRGQTAWRIITSRVQHALRPVSWVLLRIDQHNSKSKSEWSKPLYFNHEMNNAANPHASKGS